MSEQRPLTSTYRLQLHSGFGFDAATAQVPYLARLGISHVYLSPVLQAAPGSMHGYDVVDHSRVSADLGGEQRLVRLADTCHEHGLGIVVDVVPNHMALPTPAHLNTPLWETLRDGRKAATAHWFDVDWEALGGRFGLPVLGDTVDAVVAAGELTVDTGTGGQVVRNHDQVFPVAPGTEGDDVAEVLSRQHYLLGSWRDKTSLLNYRRFFDVDTLVAVRVELNDVFDATHALLIDLHARGIVDGFRIDHPDGLADPRGYLDRLAEVTGGAWVVAEKILEGNEALPPTWAAAGTTGYDAIAAVQQALVPDTSAAVDAIWREAGGQDFHTVEAASKRDALELLLQPELTRLSRAAAAVLPGKEPPLLREALAEVLLGFDVYRAYVRPGQPVPAQARTTMTAACGRATRQRPDLTAAIDALHRVLLDTATTDPTALDLLVRFGQACGPVMAKGIEDTAFYRHHRLVALNEVGGDPTCLERPGTAPLHAWAGRQVTDFPLGLTTLSTHDTKRSADVRARLLAAAGDPDGWRSLWGLVAAAADTAGVDRPTASLLLQTVVGAWPLDTARLSGYVTKALREAKLRSRWDAVDEDYERAVVGLGEQMVGDDPDLCDPVRAWVERLGPAWRCTVLAQTLLQLMLPGVPDTYQGSEVADLSLVDPDNRRPVDFADRCARLDRLDAGAQPTDLSDAKLLVVSRALRLRRDQPTLFGPGSTYEPVRHVSPHLLGFTRSGAVMTLVTRWPDALAVAGGWGGQAMALRGSWHDTLTGVQHTGTVPLGDVFAALPVALLVRTDEGRR